jgi:hypothetical protein
LEPGDLVATPTRGSTGLAKAAVVVSAVGLALCLPCLVAVLLGLALPRWYAPGSYIWLIALACGGLGIWPGAIGVVLGAAAAVEAVGSVLDSSGWPWHLARPQWLPSVSASWPSG